MVEVDNLFYERFLPEQMRTDVEKAGRVVLTVENMTKLTRSKAVHMVVMTVSVFVSIGMQATSHLYKAGGTIFRSIMVVVFGSLFSGLIEVMVAGPSQYKCKQFGIVAGKFCCGLVGFMIIMVAALDEH